MSYSTIGTSAASAISPKNDVGASCERYQDAALRDLKSKRIQCDEIWSFVYAKAKNLPEEMRGMWGVGDVWTWVAMDADTKLVPSWAIGRRDAATGHAFSKASRSHTCPLVR